MDRVKVESSNIVDIGYDKEKQLLEVGFVTGSVYQYSGVPESVHAELMSASSKGSFFSKNIRKVYVYIKIVDVLNESKKEVDHAV